MFDINFFPLNITGSQEQPELPGLWVTIPPRRPERNRSEDILILLVSMAGDVLLSHAEYGNLLEKMSAAYYVSRGTTTSAMQNCAAELNNFLLKANAKRNSADGRIQALLNMAVLRGEHLYYAHAGATHSYLIDRTSCKHFNEVQGTTRSVGLGRSTSLVFSQSILESGDALIMCPNPPESWTEDHLSRLTGLSLENLRRRLTKAVEGNVQAAILQFQDGNGSIRRLRRRNPTADIDSLKRQQDLIGASSAQSENLSLNPDISSGFERAATRPRETVPAHDRVISGTSFSSNAVQSIAAGTTPQVEAFSSTTENQPEKKPENSRKTKITRTYTHSIDLERIRSKMATIWNSTFGNLRKIDRSGKSFFRRLLPGLEDQPLELSPGVMFFIAVAVPLIVVAAATTVYIRNGRLQQHRTYLEQAHIYAVNAQEQQDNALKRLAWEKSLEWIDTAEKYASSEDSVKLRETANLALDQLDGISTFSVQPALSASYDKDVEIISMAANNTEAYLLDATSGNVKRIFLAGKAYEGDPSFNCGPGLTSSIYINKLVDLVPLPLNNSKKASVLAIDEKGNLLYCRVNSKAEASSLIPPDQPWGRISAIDLQSDMLYVLDITSNALWVYQGNDLKFEEDPTMFFGNDIPDMKSVVDFAVNEDSLYLLHKDGKITVCVYSPFDFSPTTCSDADIFVDMRPGQENQPVSIVGSRFSRIQATYPLEPSLYTLETEQGFIYHMSLQLNIHHQYRPDPSGSYLAPTQPPTSFAITPGRIMLLAYKNQVYFATLP